MRKGQQPPKVPRVVVSTNSPEQAASVLTPVYTLNVWPYDKSHQEARIRVSTDKHGNLMIWVIRFDQAVTVDVIDGSRGQPPGSEGS